MTPESERLRRVLAYAMIRAKERLLLAEFQDDDSSPKKAAPSPPRAERSTPVACECGLVTLPGLLAYHQWDTGHRNLI